jgi:3-hydroxyanthranilate 3,4-dioxygenase
MPREIMFFAYDEAAKSGPYDEKPMFGDDIDLQIHLSRNDRPQPFYLICQHDTVLVTMSGDGKVEYKKSNVLNQFYEAGDFIYIPAGTPHRVVPNGESIQLRYKLPESDREGVAWYCECCGKELRRHVWDLGKEIEQEGYLRACNAFNADAAARKCSCGTVHPAVDLSGFKWQELARQLRDADTPAAKAPAAP